MKTLLLLFCFAISIQVVNAQTADSSVNNYLKVYLDGADNYHEYIKTEIPYVNYVRDRYEAHVHLLITSQQTGSGGSDYSIMFLGQNQFEGKLDTIHFIANTNNTDDETRAGLVQIIKMGLMPYIAKLDGTIPITISYNGDALQSDTKQSVDKWNSWIYGVSSHVYANASSTYSSSSISGNLNANRVTDAWKINISAGANLNNDTYDLGDNNIYRSKNNGSYGSTTIVKSLNDHWSAGGEANYSSSTYSNYDADISIMPAVEYNIFPYAESTTKMLTFFYKIGPNYSNYIDTTIFNLTEEFLLRERLDISLSLTQKWGSVYLGVNGSNYFHDLSKNSFGCFASLNWRIVEGLSVNTFFNFDFIQDQLNIPKGDLSNEEILLQIHEQQTSFNFFTSFGISYTFGSIFNNVVNPRFDGGGQSFYFN